MLTIRLPLTFAPGDSAGTDEPWRSFQAAGDPSADDELPDDADLDEDGDWDDDDWEDEEDLEEDDPDAALGLDDLDDEDEVELPAKFKQAFRPREELPRKRRDREE